MLIRSVFRTIRSSFARYLAIVTIIALGVGFFIGLKVTRTAMLKTADGYLQELQLYDFRLISTLGLTEEDVQALKAVPGVEKAAGGISVDIFADVGTGSERALHAHSLTGEINKPDLIAGRLPETAEECLLDRNLGNLLGNTLTLSESNQPEDLEQFSGKTYRVVGLVNSPLYMNFERGTTALAGGRADGFVYLLPESFTADYYTEIYVTMPHAGAIYSEEYQQAADDLRQPLKDALEERAELRYHTLLGDAQGQIDDAQAELDEQRKTLSDAQAEVDSGWETYRKERTAAEGKLYAAKNKLDQGAAALTQAKEALEALKDSPAAALPEVQAQIAAQEALLSEQEAALNQGLAAYWGQWNAAQNTFRETEDALKDAQSEIDDALPALEDAQREIDDTREKLTEIRPATTYTLDRGTNTGYACFENDTNIVSGVAKVFPLFFFLVAAMVCITTMTRMISEKRTENGVLKAMGYGTAPIAGQFLFYSGSASILGCFLGFFLGSKFLPLALWQVYRILYAIHRDILFTLDWPLFAVCSLSYLVCAMGATWLVCRTDLRECSAQLIRPKAPPAGKRILLERIDPLWKRIRFLHKVSIRNILRYKKRMVMMILGIGGCTALLLTGFGIRDTIKPIVDHQFSEITLYDISASFSHDMTAPDAAEVLGDADAVFLDGESTQVYWGNGSYDINLVVYQQEPEGFVDLHRGKTKIAWPGEGQAVVNYRFAQEKGIAIGDVLTLKNGMTVEISGIFDNYLYDYLYVSNETYRAQLGQDAPVNTAYLRVSDDPHEAGAALLGQEGISAISVCSDMAKRVSGTLKSLDYIVLIVLVCAGALAFIVLYNLTNIMITERTRELATLKVLGFYLKEQNSYIFRENLVLTLVGILCGVPMGMALLRYVMSQIRISSVYFGCRLNPASYLLAGGVTLIFALAVDLALTGKTRRIRMAEAMKAIE